jgi:excinuclease ABC subunit A
VHLEKVKTNMGTNGSNGFISIRGAWQNNLKGFNLDIPLNKLTVVTGVSGSGKSSLAFDTIYAEGQRRYVETFSSYARQFLDRMDRPRVDRIDGIPPAIAIDQTNPVRTSRSTVGTMTELNDHLKLLFARASRLYCQKCGKSVSCDNAETIVEKVLSSFKDKKETFALITFSVTIPENFSEDEVKRHVTALGYSRIRQRTNATLEIIQDRITVSNQNRSRLIEDFEAALKFGHGVVLVYPMTIESVTGNPFRFSSGLHCPDCDITYKTPTSQQFSFNSAIGACETCRGFGRTIGIDRTLVVPDTNKSLKQGAIKPFQSESYRECQEDLVRFARRRGLALQVPWNELSDNDKEWVFTGEGKWEDGKWYGVNGFFAWLESRSYRMHVRVLLSRYRAYHTCATCKGARLKSEALLWRIGPGNGLSIHDLMTLPIDACLVFFTTLVLPKPFDEAADSLVKEIKTRLGYLSEVGLSYLTLDRQSRTLSGGEVQRINLTTAIGTSLVNALFILDEPSIGLHSRDIGRLIRVLTRLRDAGNTIIIVEHDPELIRAADFIVDLGPGPGVLGGNIVFSGAYQQLLTINNSLTSNYLTGIKTVSSPGASSPIPGDGYLEILGASEHNLKGIDIRIPLNHIVCITGVSGSGKSTLLHDICYKALRKIKLRPIEEPGAYKEIRGHEFIGDVVLVDQTPIGKTTRSNPVSHVGAFDAIRLYFSEQPLARERGYTAGTFSFNSGDGRCPRCGGNGFEHVEMQFLSDVYLRCPDCNGTRYRPEILEVKLQNTKILLKGSDKNENTAEPFSVSIADVLEMTVAEACAFFEASPVVLRRLAPLKEVGLSYMRLGQPLPTLSGGEAQRLKLAGHLSEKVSPGARGSLFLFDEPTTGLHFDDIAVLLKAFRNLVLRGHSVVIIEHNLDVIRSSDWIIDLGPEGGQAGGEVICKGSPDDVMQCETSFTGRSLRSYRADFGNGTTNANQLSVSEPAPAFNAPPRDIFVSKAREHNLRNIDVRIPRDKFTVITGVSGSGKSTLAFDILFAEGQRRYLESLNAFARQIIQPASRPDIDGISGIPPSVAIEQRTSRGGRKSTVATTTEIYHFLRLLFVKLGTRHCPDCGIPIEPQTLEAIIGKLLKAKRGEKVAVWAPIVVNRKGLYAVEAQWAFARGFAAVRVDGAMTPTRPWPRLDRFKEHAIDLPIGQCFVEPEREKELKELISSALVYGKGTVYVQSVKKSKRDGDDEETVFSTINACPRCQRGFEPLDPRLFSYNSKHGWCERCFGTGVELPGFTEEQTGEEIWWNAWWEGEERPCEDCKGGRLNSEALAVLLKGKSIAAFAALSVTEAIDFFKKTAWRKGREEAISHDVVEELTSRLAFLREVGLDYLTLDRAAPTLSGGEAQRIRLAAQLGSNLRGVCYVLDEPTIGLHARDNALLLDTLRKLREKGNTVVVVEHDAMTIEQADHIIDLGPGGGKNGGVIVAQGALSDILQSESSMTGVYLRSSHLHPYAEQNVHKAFKPGISPHLTIERASYHNLKNLTVEIPLERFVCVTGVSGSGKSTLVHDVLHENLKHFIGSKKKKGALKAVKNKPFSTRGCVAIKGWEILDRTLEVDQRPIGKTPRSCPATYIGIWDDIRRLFSKTPEASIRGYSPSRFSFNVAAGRCPSCEGQGVKKIEMSFLPDVIVTCDACNGDRFTQETLSVVFKNKTIAEILRMNVDEALLFFAFHAPIRHALQLMQDVGLGYLSLGQHSPTLSGGEAQRIKLVAELAKAKMETPKPNEVSLKSRNKPLTGRTLYVLDEPTIGLHMADVEKLVRLLRRLVDAGNTVVVIEHNLDVIAEADWIIDLGPGGGAGGGRIVAQGKPETIAKNRKQSQTAPFLAELMNRS